MRGRGEGKEGGGRREGKGGEGGKREKEGGGRGRREEGGEEGRREGKMELHIYTKSTHISPIALHHMKQPQKCVKT